MIKKLYSKLILFSVFFVIVSLNAQEKNSFVLKGKVTDALNEPLHGVLIKSDQNKQTYSSKKGEFQIPINESNVVTLALKGYKTQVLNVSNSLELLEVVLEQEAGVFNSEDQINVAFGKMKNSRVVGSVSAIDIREHLEKDQRIGLNSAIYGKVGGVINGSNVLGIGNAIYVIDGIPRDPSLINLTEIEEITILKDALSKVLYGARADQGVILITTKRGSSKEKVLTVRSDYSIQSPRRLPKYLKSADYMQVYNQANLNDGKAPRYTEDEIIASALTGGPNSLFSPDVDFYGDQFLKSTTNFLDVNMEASGGTDKVQYMLNMGYSGNNGWLNIGETEASNRFNLRANTNYALSSRLKAKLDVVGVIENFTSPNVGDFWSKAQTTLPNAYTLLIPISSITDPTSYVGANIIDGQYLLGGTNVFTSNLYGDLTQKGSTTTSDRYFQINTGLEWDLGFIADGLSFSGNLTFDFFNRSADIQNKTYAVYQPFIPAADQVSVITIGKDVNSNERTVISNQGSFARTLGVYGTLDYNKVFGKHALDLTALAYLTDTAIPNTFQNPRDLNYGFRANYMLNNTYLAEFSGVMVGSRKLPEGDRFGFSPTFGLGWILSNESFFNKNKTNFLKLKGSVGLINNDNWNNYFLYETSFSTGNFFNYSNTTGNGAVRNRELNYNNIATNIDWQKRLQYNFGFEGSFLNNTLYADANFFFSRAFDQITELNNTVPELIGYTITDNYNAFIDRGLEYTLKYSSKINDDWKISVGHNSTFSLGKVDKLDEPIYLPNAQQRIRTNKNSSAMFGLTANGLYGESDFNLDGTLVSGLPTTTFGSVQPGDIKYLDINNDGKIDDDDQSVIGNNSPVVQYSFDANITFKNFDFYVLGVGQSGQDRYRNSNYFWTYGELKYSEEALKAYGPDNKDVNASMPRLSSTRNNNNYRNSTFWLYKSNFFTIPTMQLSYNIKSDSQKVFKSIKLFVKGNDLIVINQNKNIDELRFGVGSRPVTRGFSLGLITSF